MGRPRLSMRSLVIIEKTGSLDCVFKWLSDEANIFEQEVLHASQFIHLANREWIRNTVLSALLEKVSHKKKIMPH